MTRGVSRRPAMGAGLGRSKPTTGSGDRRAALSVARATPHAPPNPGSCLSRPADTPFSGLTSISSKHLWPIKILQLLHLWLGCVYSHSGLYRSDRPSQFFLRPTKVRSARSTRPPARSPTTSISTKTSSTMGLARILHHTIFSLIILGCLAEIVTSGILIGDYNNTPDAELVYGSLMVKTRYLLFCGLWSVLFSFGYILGLSTAPGQLVFSVASHLGWLAVTTVLFVSGAAALATEIKDQHLPHQARLEILQGLAWADSILLALALVFVLAVGLGRRNGLTESLLGGP